MPSLVPRLALDDVTFNYSQTSAVSFPRACGEAVVSSGQTGDQVTLAGAMQLNLACGVLPAVVLGGGGSPLSNAAGGDAIPDNSMQNGLARTNDDLFVAKPAPPSKRLRAMLPLASGSLASSVRPTAPKRSKSNISASSTLTPTPTIIKRQTKPPYPTEPIC